MFVRPAPGKKVRDPRTKLHIPEAGIEVPEDTYWTRRLLDGDVIVVAPAAPAAAKPSSAKVKE